MAKHGPPRLPAPHCLADTGKGTVAKPPDYTPHERRCLADTGKGTVAKPWDSDPYSFQVLPTLEKELWQSVWSSWVMGWAVLPTLEKELWQSRCGELYDNTWCYVKFCHRFWMDIGANGEFKGPPRGVAPRRCGVGVWMGCQRSGAMYRKNRIARFGWMCLEVKK